MATIKGPEEVHDANPFFKSTLSKLSLIGHGSTLDPQLDSKRHRQFASQK
jgi:hypothetical protein